MNVINLYKTLIKAAKTQSPSDRVPYAFEKRIMARLSQPVADAWLVWSRGLWRAVGPCVAVMLLLGVWSHFTPSEHSSANGTEQLSQDFENTMFAAVDQDNANNSW